MFPLARCYDLAAGEHCRCHPNSENIRHEIVHASYGIGSELGADTGALLSLHLIGPSPGR
jgi:hypothetical protein